MVTKVMEKNNVSLYSHFSALFPQRKCGLENREARTAFKPLLTPGVLNLHGCCPSTGHAVVTACAGQSSARWLLVMNACSTHIKWLFEKRKKETACLIHLVSRETFISETLTHRCLTLKRKKLYYFLSASAFEGVIISDALNGKWYIFLFGVVQWLCERDDFQSQDELCILSHSGVEQSSRDEHSAMTIRHTGNSPSL